MDVGEGEAVLPPCSSDCVCSSGGSGGGAAELLPSSRHQNWETAGLLVPA